MNTSDLVESRHLSRKAKIYIRQSSHHQVIHNTESQRMQYALHDRALALGWYHGDIAIVDADLGLSGASTEQRVGYQDLVAEIALGTVGILLAYDATRLARNCTHWYQLLDLCGRFDCLIADRDGVYDPTSINGRLLLGLKGQISELELHTIRARLNAGILSKARRGELELRLPTGLLRPEPGVVIKHPDLEIQQRVDLIFRMMLQKKSITATTRWFRENDLPIPRQDVHGNVHWKICTSSTMRQILTNPAYAGAAVYGRSCWKTSPNTGRKHAKELPQEKWRFCVHDKFPSYVSWQVYQSIQTMIHDNHNEYARKNNRGVSREGQSLLQGIVYCGQCGRKMTVRSQGSGRYTCDTQKRKSGAEVCQRIASDLIDKQVAQWFMDVFSESEIDIADKVLRDCDRDRESILVARRQEVQRLRYQAQFAERQFMKSDPDNRLVTSELERRWEVSLRELKVAEEQLLHDEQDAPVYAIPAELIEQLKSIGIALPELWESGLLKMSQKKTLLRSVIDKVVIARLESDQASVRVVWRGGATTTGLVSLSVSKMKALSGADEMSAMIAELARAGENDHSIAERLTKLGHRSPRSTKVLPSTVSRIRLSHGILQTSGRSCPRRVPGFLTVSELAKKLGVSVAWIHNRIINGTIKVEKDPQVNCYLFPDTPETLSELNHVIDESSQKSRFSKGHQNA